MTLLATGLVWLVTIQVYKRYNFIISYSSKEVISYKQTYKPWLCSRPQHYISGAGVSEPHTSDENGDIFYIMYIIMYGRLYDRSGNKMPIAQSQITTNEIVEV